MLMEHLLPSGWSDVARTGDIDRLDARIDRLEAAMKEGFQSIRSSIRVMVGSFVAVSIGIIVMLVQLNQAISHL